MKINPSYYFVPAGTSIEVFLKQKVQETLSKLEQAQMISSPEARRFHSTPFGSIMAKFYTRFHTMKSFVESPSKLVRCLSLLKDNLF